MKQKVLIIGIDGGELSLIRRYHEQLPNMGRLLEAGLSGVLRSTDPPVTCPAWPSLFTGLNAGSHGCVGFQQKVYGHYQDVFSNFETIKRKSIWEILSDEGKKSLIFNVPMTYPPRPFDGLIVSGMPVPENDSGYAYPAEVKEFLDEKIGRYLVEPDYFDPGSFATDKDAFMTSIRQSIERRGQAARELLTDFYWDFSMVVFTETDRVSHSFWHFIDEAHPGYVNSKYGSFIGEVYSEIDEQVGRILSVVGPDTYVFLVSDHGFGPCYGQFFTNNFLEEKGFLKFRPGSNGLRGLLASSGVTLSNIAGFFQRFRVLQSFLAKVLPGDFLRSLLPLTPSIFDLGVDWRRTKAFCSGHHGMEVRINLIGREELGSVSPEDYDEVRDEVIDCLRSIRINDIPAKVVIRKREEIFRGSYFDEMPDLVFYLNDFSVDQVNYKNLKGRVYEDYKKDSNFWSGFHRADGIFALSGPSLKKLAGMVLDIKDIAPMVFSLMNNAIVTGFDGSVPSEMKEMLGLVDQRHYETEKHQINQPFDKVDESKIKEKLRKLGYL